MALFINYKINHINGIIILYWSGSRSSATFMQLTWGGPYTMGVAALIAVASSRLMDVVFQGRVGQFEGTG